MKYKEPGVDRAIYQNSVRDYFSIEDVEIGLTGASALAAQCSRIARVTLKRCDD